MNLSISTKDLIYGSVIAILVITMSAGLYAYKVGAHESKDNTIESMTLNDQLEGLNIMGSEEYPDEMEMSFASCVSKVLYSGGVSDTYNTNTPYDPSFWHGSGNRSQNGFFDINGDNLPDYVFSDTFSAQNSSFGDGVYNAFVGCVYLNNGHGWDKVFQCIATTATDKVTGEINVGEFRGDCAGEPSSQKQSQE